jgi:hypothetical protein
MLCLLELALEVLVIVFLVVFLLGVCRLFMPCVIIVLLLVLFLDVILLLLCCIVLLAANFVIVVCLCLLLARSRFPNNLLKFGLELKVKFVESSNFALHLLHLSCLVYCVGSKQVLVLVQLCLQ